MFNFKVFVAEFIGTFALTFIGASAGMANAGLVGVALAHGFVLAVFVYIYGNVSGTHVWPGAVHQRSRLLLDLSGRSIIRRGNCNRHFQVFQ